MSNNYARVGQRQLNPNPNPNPHSNLTLTLTLTLTREAYPNHNPNPNPNLNPTLTREKEDGLPPSNNLAARPHHNTSPLFLSATPMLSNHLIRHNPRGWKCHSPCMLESRQDHMERSIFWTSTRGLLFQQVPCYVMNNGKKIAWRESRK